MLAVSNSLARAEAVPRVLIGGVCPATRSWVRMALGSLGVECDEASSGWELLIKLANGDYDLVVADHRLPGVSGADALALLRRSSCDVPFLLLAPACRDSVRAQTTRAGRAFLVEDVLDTTAVRDASRVLLRFGATRPG